LRGYCESTNPQNIAEVNRDVHHRPVALDAVPQASSVQIPVRGAAEGISYGEGLLHPAVIFS